MANANPTESKQTAPPTTGSRPSVRIDELLAADLADIMSTGTNFTDTVRQAVGQLAAMYRTAWAHGVVPRGTAPTLAAYQFAEPAAQASPSIRHDGAAGRPSPRAPHPMGQLLPAPPPGPHVRRQYADELLGHSTPPPRPDAQRRART
ncbi:hypothetical protein H9Y04_15980 [Streptomyces sp. TRM66268-LWL]|uniref:Uncharacterized protein n=1 Tax=Streptomyces polyasparticus TaxID=2767826 RepID=A0ABR7SFS1_9ACTN|nr:hypothetical protein [Streptomyces polyasparticus]MBC9714064.1 hypothetical protein [Streptomyces polyasparticus]